MRLRARFYSALGGNYTPVIRLSTHDWVVEALAASLDGNETAHGNGGSVDIYRKAHDLGWDVDQVTSKTPYEFVIRRIGWFRTDGPEPDAHYARGKQDVESFLMAFEAGESTDRWREPR